MPDASDMELLRDYDRHGSEAAFAELVQRHINLVYSAAFRHVGIAAQSEEITQAVFIILARKASRLRPDTVLEGWLYETTRLTALSFMRGERRRQFREQEAYMQSTLQESTDDAVWNQLAPLLDEAMSRLGKTDRDAVLLRFFKDKSVREVATTMQVSEAAAQRRILRALEKLRKFFTKRGVGSTTAIIAGVISANSVHAAPVALAKSVTAVAIAKGAVASGSTLVLVKGTLKAMSWAKLKFACGISTAALLAASVVTVAVTNKANNEERYRIDGDVTYHITGNPPDKDFVRNFNLTVNGRDWAIHLTGPDLERGGIKHEEVVCLNGSVYRYYYFGTPPPGNSINSGAATIERGDFPVEDGTFANFVWVGLASAYYFAGATNGDVVSLVNRPRDARTYKDKAIWQLSDYPPYLPKSIDYYNKGGSILVGNGVTLHQFEHGWKSGEVRVLQETNINGSAFPLVYTYEQFRPKLKDVTTSNDVELQLLVTVDVHSIRFDSVSEVLKPKTDGTTAVGETRFSYNPENERIVYFSTADRLPESPEAEAVKNYNQQTAIRSKGTNQQTELKEPSNSKWIWLAAVVFLSATVLIVWLIKRKRSG